MAGLLSLSSSSHHLAMLLPQAQSPERPLESGGPFARSAAEQMQRPRETKDFPAPLQDVAGRSIRRQHRRVPVLPAALNRVPSHLGQLRQQTCLHHADARYVDIINKAAQRGERCRPDYSTCSIHTDFGIMTAGSSFALRMSSERPTFVNMRCRRHGMTRRRRHGGTMIGKSIPTASPAGWKYASSYLVHIRGLLTQNRSESVQVHDQDWQNHPWPASTSAIHNAQPRSERQPNPEAWSDAMQPAKTTLLPHILAILVPRLLTTFEHSPHTLNSPPHQPSDSHSLPKLFLPLLLSSCTAILCIDALRYACHPREWPSWMLPKSHHRVLAKNHHETPLNSTTFASSFTAIPIHYQPIQLIAMCKQKITSHRSLPDNSPSRARNSDKGG
ncbi:hypothetical protein COCC4DRAFT_131248 [Bipolaris maydis ATCC 48331]|uniref:Uncharacterized protein n=2 Tax=Cochliobolus heterostrophus TaxID=5016 RepID=M2UJX1_COCH5|nr:uncharacterized protein COCC4DRAFT_131248 [Bipolaris maydis ATCC 48331]EMD93946.1 hypothetical protein COCHEDRAFT_1027908 [Bipolaris maydis C5]ENI07752.1 hypothetical protein COCC4DRAFT_131248 [Bipolaris maydis ATCC 48331]KAJ6209404.1 hypothetical protein PSV09DRAFT_1027908 [Bipolaris maydis]